MLLIVEYIALALSFDGGQIPKDLGWRSLLRGTGALVPVFVAVLTGGVLLAGEKAQSEFREIGAAPIGPLSWHWALFHTVSFAALFYFSAQIFQPRFGEQAPALLVTVWILCVGVSGLSWFRLVTGTLWACSARLVGNILLSGSVLGLLAWGTGFGSRSLWPWLASETLRLSSSVLSIFSREVAVDADTAMLTLGSFRVEISPECSGAEGVGLVLVFLCGYLYRYRDDLRFPAVLWLLPVAIVATWLSNSARIIALMYLGEHVSRDMALGGFHSKAGWLLFCLIALGVVALSRQSSFFARSTPSKNVENATAPYLVPLFAVLVTAQVTGLFSTGFDALYPLRVGAALAALWVYRKHLRVELSTPSVVSIVVGALVFALWLWLVPRDAEGGRYLEEQLSAMSRPGRAGWILARVVGAVLTVPLIEELAFRGYLGRRLMDVDFSSVGYRRFGWLSFVTTAIVFGVVHQAWLAGTVAGIGYGVVLLHRGRLSDAVAAHAVTNALLCVAVLGFERWDIPI
ncbi:MAG: exosortase E/protease, VPEID-CTERM system [Polyangiaceae bacterium]|nr:exosortase E/protease, VPEID-CTERM system [Polyangiaceae bacterium]